MKKLLLAAIALALIPATADAKRAKVRIYKEAQPAAWQYVSVPPVAVAFDLIRRNSCDPRIAVATGPNDPGFTSKPVGNYLIPAIYRKECAAQPRR